MSVYRRYQVATMDFLIASVLTVAIAPNSSQLSESPNQVIETVTVESVTVESTSETATPETTAQRSEPTINPTQVTCPAGQFASVRSRRSAYH